MSMIDFVSVEHATTAIEREFDGWFARVKRILGAEVSDDSHAWALFSDDCSPSEAAAEMAA